MNEKYGVPRDIYAKVKIIGLFMADIVFVGGCGSLYWHEDISDEPVAPAVSLYYPNASHVSIFSFANQRRKEELAEYVSFLQTPS